MQNTPSRVNSIIREGGLCLYSSEFHSPIIILLFILLFIVCYYNIQIISKIYDF